METRANSDKRWNTAERGLAVNLQLRETTEPQPIVSARVAQIGKELVNGRCLRCGAFDPCGTLTQVWNYPPRWVRMSKVGERPTLLVLRNLRSEEWAAPKHAQLVWVFFFPFGT